MWRRDVSTPRNNLRLDGGWDVSSQKVLGCEGGHGDETSPPPRGWIWPRMTRLTRIGKTGKSMAAGMALSRPSDFAVGSAGPQTTQTDAELGGASARTEYVRCEGGSLDELSFVAVVSPSIAIHRD